jgi:hypothetical protein
MKKSKTFIIVGMALLLIILSIIYLPRIFHETPIDDMTVETVDFEDSDSVANYLYSLLPLSKSNQAWNDLNYPSTSSIQYLYILKHVDLVSSSVLIDYPQKKVIYDSHYDVVCMYPVATDNIRDLTEEDVKNIEQLLDQYDIFHWKIDYDKRLPSINVDYESMWLITIVFDDGSVFQTSGSGEDEESWPDKYFEFYDDLFALAEG